MDFASDQLVGGKWFRLLTLVDNYSRESLGIEVGQRLAGGDVVRVLDKMTVEEGQAAVDSSRYRAGVRLAELGSVGLLQGRDARFQYTEKAHG